MKIYLIWLVGVIAWNYGVPSSNSFRRCTCCNSSIFFKHWFKKIFNKIVIQKKKIYFDNKQSHAFLELSVSVIIATPCMSLTSKL